MKNGNNRKEPKKTRSDNGTFRKPGESTASDSGQNSKGLKGLGNTKNRLACPKCGYCLDSRRGPCPRCGYSGYVPMSESQTRRIKWVLYPLLLIAVFLYLILSGRLG